MSTLLTHLDTHKGRFYPVTVLLDSKSILLVITSKRLNKPMGYYMDMVLLPSLDILSVMESNNVSYCA